MKRYVHTHRDGRREVVVEYRLCGERVEVTYADETVRDLMTKSVVHQGVCLTEEDGARFYDALDGAWPRNIETVDDDEP